MIFRFLNLCLLSCCLLACGLPGKKDNPSSPQNISLKVINYNLWHGLGTGFFKRKVLEPEGRKSLRLAEQLSLLKSVDADILFLQEVNPASSLSRDIAKTLGMSYVYQTTNCGVSLLGAGLPVNLSMGIAILAKEPLEIRKIFGIKLSGGPGFCKKYLSFQYGEFRYALFALAYHPSYGSFLLVNTHLHHGPEWSPLLRRQLDKWQTENLLTEDQITDLMSAIEASNQRRISEITNLFAELKRLQEYYTNLPVILAGDFNSTPDSSIYQSVLEDYNFKDTTTAYSALPYTWDGEINKDNHAYTAEFGTEMPTFGKPEVESFFKEYDSRQRRIDYIFISPEVTAENYSIFADEPNADGLIGSDHFGVQVLLKIPGE